jgi:hypothetical protein
VADRLAVTAAIAKNGHGCTHTVVRNSIPVYPTTVSVNTGKDLRTTVSVVGRRRRRFGFVVRFGFALPVGQQLVQVLLAQFASVSQVLYLIVSTVTHWDVTSVCGMA